MLVSELAKKLSITPDTVRFYTRVNLLQPSIDSANGYKRYDNDDLHRLKFILAARNLGFSVEDIRQILDRTDHHHSACGLVRDLINRRLQETEQSFRDMVALRERMIAAASAWNQMEDQPPSNESICHLIETFSEIDGGEV